MVLRNDASRVFGGILGKHLRDFERFRNAQSTLRHPAANLRPSRLLAPHPRLHNIDLIAYSSLSRTPSQVCFCFLCFSGSIVTTSKCPLWPILQFLFFVRRFLFSSITSRYFHCSISEYITSLHHVLPRVAYFTLVSSKKQLL